MSDIIKNVIITFDFDPETEKVTNVNCSVDGVAKKKRATTKKADVEEVMAADAIIVLEENKLVFNNKAVAEMGIEYQDRIMIRWEKKGSIAFPLIGKSIEFDQEESGNKVTKTNTVAYKGKQNIVLAELGTEFFIESYKEKPYEDSNVWKLMCTDKSDSFKTLEDTIEKVQKTEPLLIITEGDSKEIDEMTFSL